MWAIIAASRSRHRRRSRASARSRALREFRSTIVTSSGLPSGEPDKPNLTRGVSFMRTLLSIALTGLVSVAAHAGPHALQPEDLYRMQWASDPQIRPDGTQIVYTREANDI